MAQHNVMTESKYNAIKMIVNGGAKNSEAARYLQVSEATVCRVKASETFEEYKNMMAAQTLAMKQARHNKNKQAQPETKPQDKPAEVVKEVRQTVTIQATHYMEEQQRRTNELLTQISAKLAFIVDELTK
jgi:hypothetical protein